MFTKIAFLTCISGLKHVLALCERHLFCFISIMIFYEICFISHWESQKGAEWSWTSGSMGDRLHDFKAISFFKKKDLHNYYVLSNQKKSPESVPLCNFKNLKDTEGVCACWIAAAVAYSSTYPS